ncbi:TROVE domain-containing protein [Amycolatopsis stemonae]
MAKFNTTTVRPATSSPIITETTPTAINHQGGAGHARDARSELFLLAVTNMVGERTFYESAENRDLRYAELVRRVTAEDPQWTARFLTWLRTEANMRTAALVGAAEYARARLATGHIESEAQPTARQVVASVLQRADEPGELLAYWTAVYGRAIPKPIKRGVADAVRRLYTERAVLKWDSDARGFRMADVLELTHPSPKPDSDPTSGDGRRQGVLFKYLLDVRHGHAESIPFELNVLRTNAWLRSIVGEFPDRLLDEKNLRAAGMTWEAALSLAGPKVDKARLWSALLPSMGYMATLRNLRNLDQAGVPDDVAERVANILSRVEEVRNSRQLPMRFLSAYKAVEGSLRWAWPLEQALGHSLANVPQLPGWSLILVDLSSSMWDRVSGKSELQRWETAAIFGVALAKRAEHADLIRYGNDSRPVKLGPDEAVLHAVRTHFAHNMGGTATAAAVQRHLRPGYHDRVIILTDEQVAYGGNPSDVVPANTPLYTWNLAGYQHGHGPSGNRNRHTFGGLTDKAFGLIPLLEAAHSATWPF